MALHIICILRAQTIEGHNRVNQRHCPLAIGNVIENAAAGAITAIVAVSSVVYDCAVRYFRPGDAQTVGYIVVDTTAVSVRNITYDDAVRDRERAGAANTATSSTGKVAGDNAVFDS